MIGSKARSENNGKRKPVLDIGGGSEVKRIEIAGGIKLIDIRGGSEVKRIDIGADKAKASRRARYRDMNDWATYACRNDIYLFAAARRNFNVFGDANGNGWVVKRLSSTSYDDTLLKLRLFSCFIEFDGTFVVFRVQFGPSSSPLKLTKYLELKVKLEEDWTYCVAHRSRLIFCWQFSMDPSDGRVSLLPDLPANRCVLMVELGGNLHLLSFNLEQNKYSLHVLDSDNKGWSKLPQPPHLGFWFKFGASYHAPQICPAVVGTKLLLFVQARWSTRVKHLCPYWDNLERRVFFFDPDSKGREWRQLQAPRFWFNLPRTVCLQARALVLNESNMNIMFKFDHKNYRIGVHTLEWDDVNDNNIIVNLIGYFKLPESSGFTRPGRGEFVHIGARKVCFVGADVKVECKLDPCLVAIPFEFDVDISQKEVKSFTLKFMPIHISELYPDNYIDAGSFLL